MRKFCDSHTDFITKIKKYEEKEEYVRSIKNCGATKIVSAVFTTEEKVGIEKLENYKKEIDNLNKRFGNILCFSIEDLGSIPFEKMDKVINLKPLSTTLTWNYNNQYGGGAKTNFGLTEIGKKACGFLEESNILIDTAHLSRKSFYDFCEITNKPIFNSHCNIFSIFQNSRNLKDEQIKQIVDSNGFIGLTFYQKFISKKKISSKNIAKQFAYLVDKFGDDSFGIGSDLFGFDKKYLPTDLKVYKDLNNLETEMKKLGFEDDTIDKLFYQNFEKILK